MRVLALHLARKKNTGTMCTFVITLLQQIKITNLSLEFEA